MKMEMVKIDNKWRIQVKERVRDGEPSLIVQEYIFDEETQKAIKKIMKQK